MKDVCWVGYFVSELVLLKVNLFIFMRKFKFALEGGLIFIEKLEIRIFK